MGDYMCIFAIFFLFVMVHSSLVQALREALGDKTGAAQSSSHGDQEAAEDQSSSHGDQEATEDQEMRVNDDSPADEKAETMETAEPLVSSYICAHCKHGKYSFPLQKW